MHLCKGDVLPHVLQNQWTVGFITTTITKFFGLDGGATTLI